ncbi:MAG: hypothetical protein M0036_02835 [Desulfobacteraceae bacterium]|nr:hypothetical protein [Desulfobacteraceae bacterium]
MSRYTSQCNRLYQAVSIATTDFAFAPSLPTPAVCSPPAPDGDPYPLSDSYQTIGAVRIDGNQTAAGIYRDPISEAVYLHAEWNKQPAPQLALRFHVDLKSRKIEPLKDTGRELPETVSRYQQSTQWVPADAYRAQAAEITKRRRGARLFRLKFF